MGASRLWWKRFVEQVSFEPGMENLLATANGDGLIILNFIHHQMVDIKEET